MIVTVAPDTFCRLGGCDVSGEDGASPAGSVSASGAGVAVGSGVFAADAVGSLVRFGSGVARGVSSAAGSDVWLTSAASADTSRRSCSTVSESRFAFPRAPTDTARLAAVRTHSKIGSTGDGFFTGLASCCSTRLTRRSSSPFSGLCAGGCPPPGAASRRSSRKPFPPEVTFGAPQRGQVFIEG